MSSRHIRGNLVYRTYYEHTGSGDIDAADIANASLVLVNKDSGAATGVTLPAAQYVGQAWKIVDAKGDAGTNNITITPDSGTINGGATYVLSENYASVEIVWDGTNYTVSAASLTSETVASQTITDLTATNATITTAGITTLNVSGITTDSNVASINAAGNSISTATALTAAISVVGAADDAVGVVLPTAVAGKRMEVYSSVATCGLLIYPPVNGTINGGSANAAITIEGQSLARFVGTSATNWAAQYTANA